MAELGTSIMKMAPQLMQAGGSIASAMGQPEVGMGLSTAGTAAGMVPGMSPTSGQMASPAAAAQMAMAGASPGMVQGYGPGRSIGQITSDVGSGLSSAAASPLMQGLSGIAGMAQKAMGGGQQPQNAQQPPPARPIGGGNGGMPAPAQQMGMGSGQQPPQAAGTTAGGMGMAQNPQYAAMIRQMLMGQGGGMG